MSAEALAVIDARYRRHRAVAVLALATGGLVAVLGVVLALRLGEPNRYLGTGQLGRMAPAFDLPTLDGGRVQREALRGRAVIVNFWNSWCVPCREEEPALRSFQARHSGEPDFVMVGIVREDTEAAVRAWVAEHDPPWTVVFDPGGRAALDFGTLGQPETFAISPSGRVVGRLFGRASVQDLEGLLARARGAG